MNYKIEKNEEFNSLEITFDGIPSPEIRDVLKQNGFRWHVKKRLWFGRNVDENIISSALDEVNTSDSENDGTSTAGAKNYRVLLTSSQIAKRIKELGAEITKDYLGKEPVIICMLKGAVYFFADLVKNIKTPIMIDFARLSSYKNGTVSGQMELISNITAEITDKDVLIVEDIVDSGKTLSFFINLLKQKHPKTVKICAFLDKKERREVDIKSDYIGFDIPCGFVIGYGLDYAEKFRELPFLAEVIDPSKEIII